jgi:hypothetical protein
LRLRFPQHQQDRRSGGHPTLLNVSDHYARFLAGKGEVTIATIVR